MSTPQTSVAAKHRYILLFEVTEERPNIVGGRVEPRATVAASTDFKNNYTYDNLGRTTKITEQGQGGRPVAEKRVEYSYDSANQVSMLSRYGDVVSSAVVMQTAYLRDFDGRVTSLSHFTSSSLAGFTLSGMGRSHRAAEAGYAYHVLNRATARMTIFESDQDFEAFERVLLEAVERTQTRLLSYLSYA
jgi:hypothetical protein